MLKHALLFVATVILTNTLFAQAVKVTETKWETDIIYADLSDTRWYPVKPKDNPGILAAKKALTDYEYKVLQKEFIDKDEKLQTKLANAKDKAAELKKIRRSVFWKKLRPMLMNHPEWHTLRAKVKAATNEAYPKQASQIPLITLNNGLMEIKIVPTLAMRILNAVDLKSNESMQSKPDPRWFEKQRPRDIIGWDGGWSEISFPYFEHGTSVRQPAGYRIIKHKNGAVTVAMNMRFTHYQHAREKARYGKYTQRNASSWVTLYPGENRYFVTYRVDNPTPTRRSDRLWVNHIMETEKYDSEHIIYPVGYITQHGGFGADPFWGEGGKRRYENVSHFGIKPDYEFCGVYSSKRNANSIMINEKDRGWGMKLYTPRGKGGFMELWTGSGVVFEDPGDFIPAYVPIEFTMTHYIAKNIGRVDYANKDVALAEEDGKFKLVIFKQGKVAVTDGAGNALAEGDLEPHKILEGKMAKKMHISIDGKKVATFNWPLTHTDTRHMQPKSKAQGGKFNRELEAITSSPGLPNAMWAVGDAKKILKNEKYDDKAYVISIAYTCYRWGRFELASQLLAKTPNEPLADYIKALIAWEKGEKVDFGKADVKTSNYMRAQLALKNGNKDAAVKLLDELIKAEPRVYRPQLLKAYLTKDVALATTLSEAHPASIETLHVLEKLGNKEAGLAKASLLKNNPSADVQLKHFDNELTGNWTFLPRYKLMMPKVENSKK